jgi:hypothetical protein
MDIGEIVREVEALPVELPLELPEESPDPATPIPVGPGR